ncbi:histidinol-phosphate aminotransferase family protein [Synechococcus sp. CS-1324]|uniref:pyridoxal phosphate-dependent aminotransferase n=1 Tax=Synechococcus sp. CS-1324 TaxID=2847980 RepID=UPI000DB0A82F|nr:histidinol-phosphate transaminase [Synechococcus sp. CS-1324]MCT0229723.1 histidinol-phosphate aminotransferase family protein [Synechococcus sp. CS-1324]PZV02475.1 MAG: histidinol-phosphate aminotransferase [Cyanobium sp.]
MTSPTPGENPVFRSGPPARPEVESLTAYSAPLEGRRGLLRLDFNENTVGPSPKVVAAIRALPAEHYAIYPEYDGLREAVVRSLVVAAPVPEASAAPGTLTPAHIGLFNGVDAALHAVFHAYGAPGERLLTTSPTFGYYAPCAGMQGMAIEAIPYRLPDFAFPFEEIQAALATSATPVAGNTAAPRLLLICNPNNPTGTRLAPQRILELAAAAPGTLVVVDELYEAFTGDSVLPPLLAAAGNADPFASCPNLLVLRSLAKTAGLAGLRFGFAVGAPALIDRVSRVGGPYDVNSFAVTAAHAALADQAYTDAYVAEVLRARAWLLAQLASAGVGHHAAGGNYLLLWPGRAAADVESELRAAGILVRSMAGKPLIDGALRVSLGTTEQMERFWVAYRRIEGLG